MDRLLSAAGRFIHGSHHGERWRGDCLSICELTSGEIVWQHEGDYAAVALYPDGKLIAAASRHEWVQL